MLSHLLLTYLAVAIHGFTAHTYHTKVPPKALVHFIEHYTKPGDIVLMACRKRMTAVPHQCHPPPETFLLRIYLQLQALLPPRT